MENRSHRTAAAWLSLAGWWMLGLAGPVATARAQRSGPGAGSSDREAPGAAKGDSRKGKAGAPAGQAEAPRREPSREFREGLRRTLEKRRRRRARRAQALGIPEARPPGAIVPWPMPPALIIRQTPEVHGEVDGLLGRLRRRG